MVARLRIAIAVSDAATRELLEGSLTRLGYQVEVVTTGQDLVELCRSCDINLMIAELDLPPAGAIEAAQQIYQRRAVPLIAIVDNDELSDLDCPSASFVFGFLLRPIRPSVLTPVIELAERRFEELQVLRDEAACLRRALCDRKIIEQAKGLIMRQSGMDEAEAFRRLQKFARNKSKKLSEVAEMIITAQEASGLFTTARV